MNIQKKEIREFCDRIDEWIDKERSFDSSSWFQEDLYHLHKIVYSMRETLAMLEKEE